MSTGALPFQTFNKTKCSEQAGKAPYGLMESLESWWLPSAPRKSYTLADKSAKQSKRPRLLMRHPKDYEIVASELLITWLHEFQIPNPQFYCQSE